MTGDLELWLRGMFHNRWACQHVVVELQTVYGAVNNVFVFQCTKCGCMATVDRRAMRTGHFTFEFVQTLEFICSELKEQHERKF